MDTVTGLRAASATACGPTSCLLETTRDISSINHNRNSACCKVLNLLIFEAAWDVPKFNIKRLSRFY